MKFNYRTKGFELKKNVQFYLENEFSNLDQKYLFIEKDDKVHVDIEMLKESKIHLKIEIFIFKLGKKFTSSHTAENIYTSINEVRQKTNTQLLKAKEKKFSN